MFGTDPHLPGHSGPGARAARLQAISAVMARQHGVLTGAQARELGLTRSAERHLVEAGILRRAAPGVLVAAAAPATWWQSALVAVTTPGVLAVSHGAAARLHGLVGFASHTTVEVIVGRGAHPRVDPRVVVRRTRADPSLLTARHVVRRHGIASVDLGSTLCQVAADLDRARLQAILVGTLATTPPSRHHDLVGHLVGAAAFWRARGRRGPTAVLEAMRELGMTPTTPRRSRPGASVRRGSDRASGRPPTTGRSAGSPHRR